MTLPSLLSWNPCQEHSVFCLMSQTKMRHLLSQLDLCDAFLQVAPMLELSEWSMILGCSSGRSSSFKSYWLSSSVKMKWPSSSSSLSHSSSKESSNPFSSKELHGNEAVFFGRREVPEDCSEDNREHVISLRAGLKSGQVNVSLCPLHHFSILVLDLP